MESGMNDWRCCYNILVQSRIQLYPKSDSDKFVVLTLDSNTFQSRFIFLIIL